MKCCEIKLFIYFNRKINNEITILKEIIAERELLEKKQKEVEKTEEQLKGNRIRKTGFF